jgi:hypothetical protein
MMNTCKCARIGPIKHFWRLGWTEAMARSPQDAVSAKPATDEHRQPARLLSIDELNVRAWW